MAGAACQPSAAPPAPGPARLGPATRHLLPCAGSAPRVPGTSGCCTESGCRTGAVQSPPVAGSRRMRKRRGVPGRCRHWGGGGWRQGGEMRGGVGLFGGKRRSVGQCYLIAFQSCPPPLGFGWGRAPCGLPGGPGTAENGVETLSPSPYKQGPFTIYQGCAIFQPKYIPLLLPAASVWAQRSPDEDREPRSASPCPVACLAPQQLLSWPQARSPVVENLP